MKQQSTILICGYGYIGQKLLQLLEQREVITLSRNEVTHQLSNHQHLVYDLDSPKDPLQLINTSFPLSIIYLVPPQKQNLIDQRIANLLTWLQKAKKQIEHFTLISTTAVYGDCKGQWIDETHQLSLKLDKAKRRFDVEKQTSNFCDNQQIPLTTLRVAGIYAKDKLPLKRLTEAKPILNELESPYSNRIHTDDLVSIILSTIEQKHTGIFNCSDSTPSTMSHYFKELAHALKLPKPPEISLEQAQKQLSAGMMSYLSESRRISNKKLLETFKIPLKYPSLQHFLDSL